MSAKKVLIISQYFPPDISGGGTRAYNYALCLAQQGYEVTVITAHPHLHAKVSEINRKKTMKKETAYGFNVIKVWIPSLLHTSARNRIILHFAFIISSLFPLFHVKPDVIFASEPNLFAIIPAYVYSKLRGGKVIRVVDDLWPEAIYERGYVKSGMLRYILDKLAKFSYSYPEYILPLTDEAKNLICNSYNINGKKIEVLLHGVDTNIYKYVDKKSENDFVLMYSGSLVESYDFDLILKAAKELKNKNIKFIIRGRGTLQTLLHEKKEKMGLENFIVDTNIVPLDQIYIELSKADVLLAPMKNEYALNSTLPTKLLEYQAVGRPIICCSNGSPGKYIENTKSGIRVDSEDLVGFVQAISRLASNQVLCRTLGLNGRKFVEENLAFEKIGMRLSFIIQQLFRNN
ncbi:hypothetical protein NSIN_10204 [Nitrosotalea sinensis]|uniref:Uncharacterized protein n=1 Tax=Nitrosotalea sinensis TaxID=1499975 RepID=A0A2H1EEE0_9ARCH|nr:glycosyltransferase family 4 protein [Candidatus Nitrosotalea sinensis]SHO42858.1 hypothetical protein NSIN_10204 [Candidatus Nitrosotalea sinensis]